MLADILETISAYETIIIHRHLRPDPDALGSQMGLKAVLQATYPEKNIYAVGDMDDSMAHFGAMDEIPDQAYEEALVIINDTANLPRVDDDRYDMGIKLIKIDHHPNTDPYGDFAIVDPDISSTSELWASIIFQTDNDLVMTDEAAKCFYLGIVGDTGRFLFDNTHPHTHAIAGKLLAFDFPATELMQASNTQTLAQARLQGYVLEHIQLTASGQVASVYISQDILKKYGLNDSETYGIVQLPGSIEGVKAWVNFIELPSGVIRCRIRSKGPIINTVAEKHDGGGHPKASGANAHSQTEMATIVAELDKAALDHQS
ncbi:DHH family phosphoesterase [Aerococcus kribbianus]|uniref:Bifunctional oligoribonuclease/PAP phosphatase NrnA n=1 Tax=Aerococcus kribbianus TaxID=2999064 RepID=A0A9X3FVR0_9LACT|nr:MULTISPECIES: bifunctional oligoribonuclease/PAP phosphatase NrnA [unclassified Aerococcus]MCZ0717119.1 bifunctional oligoribonuclease/PAP phosphatase NrnA [Aerococcus sp. YH-aer221]MCZ0725407.1 bifunctional oligoribonuclease/PAP phosphatase NrnA [Aerococcus sp. YH-aer222]